MNMIQSPIMKTMILIALTTPAFAANLQQQREMYQNMVKQLEQNPADPAIKQRIAVLKDYPLYPYLEYQYLSNNLSSASYDEVQRLLSAYPQFGLAQTLRTNFAKELSERGQWKQMATLLNGANSVSDQCQYAYAQWMLGQKTQAKEAAVNLWLSASDRPAVCNPLFDVWRAEQPLTSDTILLRLGMTIEARNTKLARYVVGLLPESDSALKSQITKVLDNAQTLPEFAQNVAPSGFSHQVIHAIFPQFVRKNVASAQASLPQIVRQQKIAKADQKMLETHIAAYLIRDDITPQQKTWRDNFIRQSKDGELMEKRIRYDLAKGDFRDLHKWLDILPEETKQKEEWVYWRADHLIAQGNKKQGDALLRSLLKVRGFYPMLSAQRLKVAYPIQTIHRQPQVDKALLQSFKQDKNMARIKELLYWKQLPNALREWRIILDNRSASEIAAYAYFAKNQNWGLLSVQATIMGKLWNNFDERFPLVYSPLFKSALKDKSISHSYAIAIARQESALHPEVMSPAGARGLMQLMPATAKEVARKSQLQHYSSVQQLLDPSTNIQLGTSYLETVYQTFDQNRILSSAAYNAGPGRVRQWLKRSNGALRVDAFIESIPFNETRNYVKNVLMYDYIYRYIMGQSPKTLLTQSEINRQY